MSLSVLFLQFAGQDTKGLNGEELCDSSQPSNCLLQNCRCTELSGLGSGFLIYMTFLVQLRGGVGWSFTRHEQCQNFEGNVNVNY